MLVVWTDSSSLGLGFKRGKKGVVDHSQTKEQVSNCAPR